MVKVNVNGEKNWWQSKTFWVNAFALAGGVFLAVSDNLAAGGALTLSSLANIALRVVTREAIKW